MNSLRTSMVVLIMVLIGLSASHGHGESISDDQRLILAADENDTVTVRRLLKAGASFYVRDGQGRTALLAATSHNHVESARLLIEAGAECQRAGQEV